MKNWRIRANSQRYAHQTGMPVVFVFFFILHACIVDIAFMGAQNPTIRREKLMLKNKGVQ